MHIVRFFFYCLIPILLLTITSCHKEKVPPPSSAVLMVSSEGDPQTLDPRQARDLATATVIHALYEGLMRLDKNGHPSLALAESLTISPDQKTYTFGLRPSGWSNGKPVIASDFENTWKTVLDPHFPAPNAYQFYIIKGAKAAKEGKLPLDQVGIKAIDDYTLVVELEQPAPYFPHLISSYFYYPVYRDVREKSLTSEKMTADNLVTNGPFRLQNWIRHNELTVVTNPYYWDTAGVQLDKITFATLDNSTALAMFERGELDWTGSPISTLPTDALLTLKEQKRLEIAPGAGVHLFRLNVEKLPFNHQGIRQALSLALNRKEIVEHVLQGNQIPAAGIIPLSFMDSYDSLFQDYDHTKAVAIFQQALNDLGLHLNQLPPIILCYAAGERNHKIAQVVQQQWKQALGLNIQLQSCESKVLFDRLKNKDYQISIGSWYADFRDPISFLDVFKFKDNGTNNTQWENPQYIQLLNLSALEANASKRNEILTQAEKILMNDMPVIPLFYASYNYLKKSQVKDVYLSELGYLDFKWARVEK